MSHVVHGGDCLDVLRTLDAASIDAVVTDPPYELGFMGKKWDATGIAYSVELWREALRVLKPGGHMLAFGGTRTYHRMTCAIEDAGFEVRDSIHWIYGTGFPKSLDVSKAIDKDAGAEREVIGANPNSRPNMVRVEAAVLSPRVDAPLTAPATDAAKKWAGFGTALKPAHEPIVLARKPLEGTVAANVQSYGTGALNIDAARIEHASEADRASATPQGKCTAASAGSVPNVEGAERSSFARPDTSLGRWPANLLLDEAAAAELDAKSGDRPSGSGNKNTANRDDRNAFGKGLGKGNGEGIGGDSGGASRFFWVAKPSSGERDNGIDHLRKRTASELTNRAADSAGINNPRAGAGRTSRGRANAHPTVKPVELMRYLCKLITPPGGTVLDPFCGSGTTGVGAVAEGFSFVGIEREPEYVELARARIEEDMPLFSRTRSR